MERILTKLKQKLLHKVSFETNLELFEELSKTPNDIFEIKEIFGEQLKREYFYKGNIVGTCYFTLMPNEKRAFIKFFFSINGMNNDGFNFQYFSKDEDQRFLDSKKNLLALKGIEDTRYKVSLKNLGEFMMLDMLMYFKNNCLRELNFETSRGGQNFYKKIFNRFFERGIITGYKIHINTKHDGYVKSFQIVF